MTMWFAYNLMFDSLSLPVNFIIIIKEFSMEFFQTLKHNAGEDSDDVSLQFEDIEDTFWTIVTLINPMNWYETIYDLFNGTVEIGELSGEKEGEDESNYFFEWRDSFPRKIYNWGG
jgi:hypothetical protein